MKGLPLLVAALCAGCAPSYEAAALRPSHIDRVLEDVSAMIEGMAGAHTEDRIVLRGPDFRSSSPRAPQ